MALSDTANNNIQQSNPAIYEMLSDFGKRIYFPSNGILAQSAEAKKHASKYNATIGIATENNKALALNSISSNVNLDVNNYLPYAPSFGLKELREKWQELQLEKNPTLKGKNFSLPIVTNALTHGINLATKLFIEENETILLPNHFWGNYKLFFDITCNIKMQCFDLFDQQGNFNFKSLEENLDQLAKNSKKINLLLNFPNNPTGFSFLEKDVEPLCNLLLKYASSGIKFTLICDDAYFGLFFEDECLQESLFAYFADLHENILAIKVDGATKEDYVWGLRCGFISYGCKQASDELYQALEDKTAGAIRASVSNISHLGQRLVLESLNNPNYAQEKQEKYTILKNRYLKIKSILKETKFGKYFKPFPYNAGYFMTIELLGNTNAEEYRSHLLKNYQIGVIAIGENKIRIAFSCIEEQHLEELLNDMYEAIDKLNG